MLGNAERSVDTPFMVRLRAGVLLFALVMLGSACSTYRDQLARGQRAFEQNDHDRTLAILRDLEPEMKRLSVPEQASYAYLRGMSDYRIGYRADARHWLSLAKAYEDHSPGVLPADWKTRTNEALDELNGVVYAHGTSALSTSRQSQGDALEKDIAGGRAADGESVPAPSGAKPESRDAKKDVPAGSK